LSAPGIQSLRRQVVLVDQHPVLFSGTVYTNIEFGLKIRKIDRSRRVRIIDEVLEMVDLASLKQQPVHGLSGGEIQRIALARALALSPEVLLCDEPTASVDVENQAAVVAILRKINRDSAISIIFTTHDRLQATARAHESLVLEQGALVRSAYENVFACTLNMQQNSQVLCCLQGCVDLVLAGADHLLDKKTKKISIDPERILLLENEPKHCEGILQGKVVQLMVDGDRVRMVVDTGVMITVLLPFAGYKACAPAIGDHVFLQVAGGAVI
jgi:tungstate transport system ATP-binding protein